jgi:N-acetylmuramoyl-L-alanine amidase
MDIKNHLLIGENVKQMKAPSMGGEFKPGAMDTVVIHYTGSPFKSTINTFQNPTVKVSAHLLIGRDGQIIQFVPFNTVAWHAGESSYQGRTGFNQYSIGIEVENSGPLTKSGNIFRTWYGSSMDASDVIEATHRNERSPRYWQTYTEEQIQLVKEICELFVDTYDIKFILGHEEIAPGRKTDPGPAFPLDKLRSLIINYHLDNDDAPPLALKPGKVAANKLNVRLLPDTNAALAGLPLIMGQDVAILEERDGWYKIMTPFEGWILGKYVQV